MQIRQKIRAKQSAEAIIGGVFGPLSAPQALILGLPDEWGHLSVAGRTTMLPPTARGDVGVAVLTAPQGLHPWPPRISSSRWGQLPPEPVFYTPVEPNVVVEVLADYAFEDGRWRHPTTFRALRTELHPVDLQHPR